MTTHDVIFGAKSFAILAPLTGIWHGSTYMPFIGLSMVVGNMKEELRHQGVTTRKSRMIIHLSRTTTIQI